MVAGPLMFMLFATLELALVFRISTMSEARSAKRPGNPHRPAASSARGSTDSDGDFVARSASP
jgi:hypothetical protein